MDNNVVNIEVPRSWADLSQEQLLFLLETIVSVQANNRERHFRNIEDFSTQTSAQVAVECFLKWSGMTAITPYNDGWIIAYNESEFYLDYEILADAIKHLSWIGKIPDSPVRLECVDGAHAAIADLSEDFPFERWLFCENLWQGYNVTGSAELLQRMAEVLYDKPGISLSHAETIGIFYWWAAVKANMARIFCNFFKPVAPDNGFGMASPDADSLRKSKDAQIRALTKGDITKEEFILSMETWRALTELDAQAREYDEINRKYGKS